MFGAPGPVAMTLASGRGDEVADEGRKRPWHRCKQEDISH